MAEEISIVIADKAAADAIYDLLCSRGFSPVRIAGDKAVQFGMKLRTPAGPLQISSTEIIQLVIATPKMVDAVLTLLERLKDRSRVYVNGREYDRLTKPKKTFTEWVASTTNKRQKKVQD